MPSRASRNSDSEERIPRVIPIDAGAPSLTSSRTLICQTTSLIIFFWIDCLDNSVRTHTLCQGGLHRQGEVCEGSQTWAYRDGFGNGSEPFGPSLGWRYQHTRNQVFWVLCIGHNHHQHFWIMKRFSGMARRSKSMTESQRAYIPVDILGPH